MLFIDTGKIEKFYKKPYITNQNQLKNMVIDFTHATSNVHNNFFTNVYIYYCYFYLIQPLYKKFKHVA